MNENEFLLFDRLEKIKATVNQYGEDNCCISFSGGKDSTVLHYMVDMALPNNHIPRVYANTGIELNMIKNFVTKMSKYDYRIKMIKPSKSIRKTLEEFGYPFKSKEHSQRFMEFKKYGIQQKHIQRYLGLWKRPNDTEKTMKRYMCPAKLRYQFTDEFCKNGLDISDECCKKMKEEPIRNWQIENNRLVTITGIMQDEGGRRNTTPCISHKPKGIINFNPLTVITKKFVLYNVQAILNNKADVYRIIGHFADEIHMILIWYKPNAQPQHYSHRISNCYEMVIVFKGKDFNKKKFWLNTDGQRNVIVKNINADRTYSKEHRAIMSYDFAEEIIKNYTEPEDTVFDAFSGLATTGIACVKNGRNYVGTELDKRYYELSLERIKNS